MHDKKLPPGTNYCKCSACGEYFGGVRGFELHRVGPADERSCLPPARVSDSKNRPLLKRNNKGYWVGTY